MVVGMAERREQTSAKINLGVRVLPAVKARLEEIASEISAQRYPARVSTSELVEAWINEGITRYEKDQTKGKGR